MNRDAGDEIGVLNTLMRMTFRVTGKELDFDILETASGIKPTSTSRCNQRPGAAIAQDLAFDAWSVRIEASDSLDASCFMQAFCSQIGKNTTVLGDALERMSAQSCFSYCVEMGLSNSSSIILGWAAEQIRCMHETRADLDIDSYVLDDAHQRNRQWASLSWMLSLSDLHVGSEELSSAIALQPNCSDDSQWCYCSTSVPTELGSALPQSTLSNAFTEAQCQAVRRLVEDHSAKAQLVLRISQNTHDSVSCVPSLCLSNDLIGMIARMRADFRIDC